MTRPTCCARTRTRSNSVGVRWTSWSARTTRRLARSISTSATRITGWDGPGSTTARRSALRRAVIDPGPSQPVIRVADVEIDLARRRVVRADQEVHLTPTEFDLVRVLAQQVGRVITHGYLLR